MNDDLARVGVGVWKYRVGLGFCTYALLRSIEIPTLSMDV